MSFYLDVEYIPEGSSEPVTIEYEIEVSDFYAGSRATYHDPADTGEVTLAPFVKVWGLGEKPDVTTLDTALREYAASRGMTLATAEGEVMHRAWEWAAEDAAERYEDGPDV